MSDVVLSVENVSKRFRIGAKPHAGTLREAISAAASTAIRSSVGLFRRPSAAEPAHAAAPSADPADFWALRNVSFEVRRGEVLGIIGRNGAGKSTLLKIISRITEPTTWRVGIRGRIGSLLEVGTGFHPELTGRENIYLNGRLLGMTRSEIRRKFDEIVDFAGIANFIDTPVKRYSSGMTVRLGFAAATVIDPEILILDEVLSVGDAEFQSKCSARIQHAMNTGDRTVLIVSHNMSSIEKLADRCLLLEEGRALMLESAHVAAEQYLRKSPLSATHRWSQTTDRDFYIASIVVTDASGGPLPQHHDQSQPFAVTITVVSSVCIPHGYIGIYLCDRTGTPVLFTDQRDALPDGLSPGITAYTVAFPGRLLKAGEYTVSAGIAEAHSGQSIEQIHDCITISLRTVDEPYRQGRAGFLGVHLDWRRTQLQSVPSSM